MSGQQQTMYTIHESQLNSGNNGSASGGNANQRNGSTDILIDTSSIPLSQQTTMPPMQHQHQPLQPQQAGQQQQQQQFDAITSQPGGLSGAGSSKVAPENQNVVYSVHPVFNMLDNHDTMLIKQRAEPTSTCCGFESVNSYMVRAKDGSPLLKATEHSSCLERCCFEGNREYNLNLVHNDEVVARIRKLYRVSRFCCYSNAVRIESPEDNPIGYIRQLFTFFGHPRYAIYDCQQPPKQPSFYLESTSCRFCCTPFLCTCMCGNSEFRVVSAETKDEVGTIARHWQSDSPQQQQQQQDEEEPFNGKDEGSSQMFGIQFSSDLEARHKVLLLSACFMMDFFYFENDRRRRKLASC